MSVATASIVSKPPGQFLSLEPTNDEPIQFILSVVQIDAKPRVEEKVIVASGSSLAKDKYSIVLNRLAAENPGCIVALIVDDSTCSTTVISTPQSQNALPVAAAVVVFKRSWGWEECDSFLVSVNGSEMSVRAAFNGARWIVSEL